MKRADVGGAWQGGQTRARSHTDRLPVEETPARSTGVRPEQTLRGTGRVPLTPRFRLCCPAGCGRVAVGFRGCDDVSVGSLAVRDIHWCASAVRVPCRPAASRESRRSSATGFDS